MAIADDLQADVLERFLRYVRIDTQSDEDSESYPSTEKQLDLLRLLADELKEIGLDDADRKRLRIALTETLSAYATPEGVCVPTTALVGIGRRL